MRQIQIGAWVGEIAVLLALVGMPAGQAAAGMLEIEFDAADFTPGTLITNPYWPLIPGTSFVYFAESEDGCAVNQVTVTGNTKSDFANEYATIVAWEVEDREWLDEECSGEYLLMEETVDWYAQDNFGNIWYFGEDTVAYDDDEECPSSAGSFEAGSDGAQAGIVVLADPSPGDSYQQEQLEGEAEDHAKVLRLDAPVSIELGEYAGCMKTKEWTPLERGSIEHKYYCPEGGGLMLIEELKGKTVVVELIGDTLPEGDFAAEGVCAE